MSSVNLNIISHKSPSIDYFSLAIESVEIDVLETIPWDKVDIKILSIGGGNGRPGYAEKVDEVMVGAGFTKYFIYVAGN